MTLIHEQIAIFWMFTSVEITDLGDNEAGYYGDHHGHAQVTTVTITDVHRLQRQPSRMCKGYYGNQHVCTRFINNVVY